ncbi:hypothetical protein [Frondihabitans peucedani]|uniref:Fe-S cluster assembly iron-binding protein IscA n=1 Tax=Frondihabitans peucedani TaxID=598626 RepID=A0ABP8E220_9MICO
MERIHYADGAILTGSDIARALLDYAEALAKRTTSATVDIPFREREGGIGRANFLIGPASQIVAETVESDFEEVRDPALVAHLQQETLRLDGVPVQASDQVSFDASTEHGFEYRDEDF